MLVTGATGYVGGRLAPRLLEKGYPVRVLVREAARLQGKEWADKVEVVEADALAPRSLPAAMQGISNAYYLIHSMRTNAEFYERDLAAARNFGAAAREAGVKRIIYLGGLGDPEADLSRHLRSRQRVGEELRAWGVSVTEFRAAVIIGSGSASFEMVRYLVEGAPMVLCPRWVSTRVQPIGIRDVLDYLVAALEAPESAGQVIEIGGWDVLTYRDILLNYAKARGLRRNVIPIPLLDPQVCSYLVDLLTPIPRQVARPLIEGLRNETIVRGDKAAQLFPQIHPMDCETALHRALVYIDTGQVETAWSDALSTSQRDEQTSQLSTREGMIMQRFQRIAQADSDATWNAILALATGHARTPGHWLWRLRGRVDSLLAGAGLRGRRHPTKLRIGDVVDYWRVEEMEPGRMLRLRAELRLPGKSWLLLEVDPLNASQTRLVQTAFFAPRGFAGLLYWYLLLPVRTLLLHDLLRWLARRAEQRGSHDELLPRG